MPLPSPQHRDLTQTVPMLIKLWRVDLESDHDDLAALSVQQRASDCTIVPASTHLSSS